MEIKSAKKAIERLNVEWLRTRKVVGVWSKKEGQAHLDARTTAISALLTAERNRET
jgi:hypothetical protein